MSYLFIYCYKQVMREWIQCRGACSTPTEHNVDAPDIVQLLAVGLRNHRTSRIPWESTVSRWPWWWCENQSSFHTLSLCLRWDSIGAGGEGAGWIGHTALISAAFFTADQSHNALKDSSCFYRCFDSHIIYRSPLYHTVRLANVKCGFLTPSLDCWDWCSWWCICL